MTDRAAIIDKLVERNWGVDAVRIAELKTQLERAQAFLGQLSCTGPCRLLGPEADQLYADIRTALAVKENPAMTDDDEVRRQLCRPSTIHRPRLFIDGNMWCALYGLNLQDGVAGFGKSPDEAYRDFDGMWFKPLPAAVKEATA